ncbi:hypothetical protein [Streptomyces sp. CPS1]
MATTQIVPPFTPCPGGFITGEQEAAETVAEFARYLAEPIAP